MSKIKKDPLIYIITSITKDTSDAIIRLKYKTNYVERRNVVSKKDFIEYVESWKNIDSVDVSINTICGKNVNIISSKFLISDGKCLKQTKKDCIEIDVPEINE
jgi:hypothetical protein